MPGDPSQAAFWAVAAHLADQGEVTVDNLYPGFWRSDSWACWSRWAPTSTSAWPPGR
ncbi:hypothetical protein AB0G32_38500 [Streptomyces sp. NPDC023723]|uniref:hypothetical protein n=1 Tax=Streptomyces sp. NPDC023723 TaxID=3154323 RepID=UPI00340930CE